MRGKLISDNKQVFDIEVTDKDPDNALCPLCSHLRQKHSREKCLNINKAMRVARCNHCGVGFKFVFEYEFRAGVTTDHITTKDLVDPTGNLLQYVINDRKISANTLISCSVKMAHRKIKDKKTDQFVERLCIAFVYTENGIPRMIKFRDKYKNFAIEKGSRLIFYGLDWIKNEKECVIVEGEFDRLAYHQVGITSVVSVPNGVTLSQEEKDHFEKTGQMVITSAINMKYLDTHMSWFDNKEKIYLATDTDAAGLKLREEFIRRFGKGRCSIINFSTWSHPDHLRGCKDANDVLIHHGPEALKETLKQAKPLPLDDVVHFRI